jgi:signal peptidase I
MTPTLQVGDRVLVNKLAVRFGEVQRGEVVVFHPPEGSQSGSDLIKRAVAIEGDTIESIGGIVHVNGQPLDETYLPPGTTTVDLPETIVPQGHIWVMGDNRGNSEDSRDFRAVPESLVQGEAFMKVWPLGNIGGL